MPQARLVEFAPVEVDYLRHVGPYGAPVAAFWQEVALPWLAANGRLQEPRYGVVHDNPEVVPPDQCRYDVAIARGQPLREPRGARTMRLPGGPYAVCAFRGTPAELALAKIRLRDEWLPRQRRRLDGRPILELVPIDPDYDPLTGAFSCDFALPARPL